MMLPVSIQKQHRFLALNQYVEDVQRQISATASAVIVIHDDEIVNHWYSGNHDSTPNSRPVQEDSQFNIASIRKTYLGFAISLALYEGRIESLDDPIIYYLEDLDKEILMGTTIRHLLTHTHGLQGQYTRLFPPGKDWKYNNAGVNLLIKLVKKLYNQTLSELIADSVFNPCGFKESGWKKVKSEKLVWLNEQYVSEEGEEANLFVSTEELAYWGYLHLTHGKINQTQIIPKRVFEISTQVITPRNLDEYQPRHGFFWYVQDKSIPLTELGDQLPRGSFQSLGSTGCACLVIPESGTVAVRMYNQIEQNPKGYDYLKDIWTFGNTVFDCISS